MSVELTSRSSSSCEGSSVRVVISTVVLGDEGGAIRCRQCKVRIVFHEAVEALVYDLGYRLVVVDAERSWQCPSCGKLGVATSRRQRVYNWCNLCMIEMEQVDLTMMEPASS
jgi:hypothetical protein